MSWDQLQKISLHSPNLVQWKSVETDPESIAIKIVNNNPSSVHNPIPYLFKNDWASVVVAAYIRTYPTGYSQELKDGINTADNKFTLDSLPGIKPGKGYQINIMSSVRTSIIGNTHPETRSHASIHVLKNVFGFETSLSLYQAGTILAQSAQFAINGTTEAPSTGPSHISPAAPLATMSAPAPAVSASTSDANKTGSLSKSFTFLFFCAIGLFSLL